MINGRESSTSSIVVSHTRNAIGQSSSIMFIVGATTELAYGGVYSHFGSVSRSENKMNITHLDLMVN